MEIKQQFGVSGGPDSICLLNILEEIKKEGLDFEIIVAHVNHCIRQEAIDDENFVKEYCEKHNISIYIKRAKVEEIAKNEKQGLEEAGRNVRYNFFEEVANKTGANKIAIAHNANDNAETIFMNIIRGSGIAGLKGIEPIRDGKYIRPIIECQRKEIEKYCEENNLKPRIDKTNKENDYTRNKIRNICIPYLEKEFNPSIIESLNRLGEIAREETGYIERIVEETYNNIVLKEKKGEKILLSLEGFNNSHLVIKRRLVLYTISKLCGNARGIQKIHIEDILKLCQNNIGNKYLTPQKYIKILVKDKKIYFISQSQLSVRKY